MASDPSRLQSSSKVGSALIGRMVAYYYDAKHKATLPYWDRFPVGFPIEYQKDRVLFINLHYLPPLERAKLMNGLYGLQTKNANNEKKQLALSYEFLKGRQYSLGRYLPCLKMHLYSHIRSKPFVVHPDEWDFFMCLPTAQFQKAGEEKVWADSMSKYKAAR